MHKVSVLFNVFDSNMSIYPEEYGPDIALIEIYHDMNEILFHSHDTGDGIPQFEDIKDVEKSNLWFMRIIFEASEMVIIL